MSATGNGGRQAKTDAVGHRVDIDWDQREPVSIAIQTALGEVKDREVTELAPLANHVDPDALESFFTGSSEELATRSLTFEYEDHTVHVDGTGYVLID